MRNPLSDAILTSFAKSLACSVIFSNVALSAILVFLMIFFLILFSAYNFLNL